MKKKRKIDYKRRRRNLIIGIIFFIIFISSLCSYIEKMEAKNLAEKTFKDKNRTEVSEISYKEK